MESTKKRIAWLIVPPILFTLLIFVYFFRIYKAADSKNSFNKENQGQQEIKFDPYGIRDMLPLSISSHIVGMVLCLNNRNQIFRDGKVFDAALVNNRGEVEVIGAMAVHLSEITNFEIYKLRNSSGCELVDAEKLFASKVTTDINMGEVFVSTSSEQNTINLRGSIPEVNYSKSLLYARLGWKNIIIIFLTLLFVIWPGALLLWVNIIDFIRKGSKK